MHIADVAEYVRAGTDLDLEARLRGTSVYFPDRAIPMLPQELSTNICSLRPDEDRLVLSCIMQLDADGRIESYEIVEGVIRSAARMTYTEVHAILEGDAETRARYAELVPDFERMQQARDADEQAARRARQHRLRSARAGDRVRRAGADARRDQVRAHLGQPADRRVHAGRQRVRGHVA